MASSAWLKQVATLPLLARVPESAREKIANLMVGLATSVELEAGDVLIQEGALGGTAGYILVQGQVSVERSGASPLSLPAPSLLGEMQQFNPVAQRTATVTAENDAVALKFTWPALYARAKETLSEEEQHLLLAAIEHCVWERFHEEVLLDLPLLRGLPDQLRLQICILLHWLAQPVQTDEGNALFLDGETCGGHGYLLLEGRVALVSGGQTRSTVQAPNILGIFPAFDPDASWTATARATTAVTSLKFNWQELDLLLRQRISPEGCERFSTALTEAQQRDFVH